MHESSGSYRLLACIGCGTQFLRPEDDDLTRPDGTRYWAAKAYKLKIYQAPDVQEGYERRYREVLGLVRARIGELRSVLDVGCGVGNFLAFAEDEQLDAIGVDVDTRPIEVARERGLRACDAAELDGELANASVDLVTLWDVIEHVLDPAALLRDTVRKLRPGGALVVEAPDGTFPIRRIARLVQQASGGRIRAVSRLYYWEHKTYFSPEGLRRLVESEGCEPVLVRHLTSSRAKMAHLFARSTEEGAFWGPLVEIAWPRAEALARRVGLGNKILLVARRHGAEQ